MLMVAFFYYSRQIVHDHLAVMTMKPPLEIFTTIFLSVSWAYKECPKFETPDQEPSKCISKVYGKPFRTSNPKTICVEMSLRCNLLRKLQSNCTFLTFKCLKEDVPQTQLSFERRVSNATWIEKLTSVKNVIIRVCVVPDEKTHELQCTLFADVAEEAIRRGYFLFNVDLKRMKLRNETFLQNLDTLFSCNCSHYERFFSNQWSICVMSRNQLESNPLGQPIMLTIIFVVLCVIFTLSCMSTHFEKCFAKK